MRGELGRYPLKLNVENRIKSFFDHVKKAPEDSLIYQAYLMNLELPSDLNCNTHIENVKRNLDLVDFYSCTKHIFKLSYKNYYNKYWTREMSSSKKGEFLFLLRKGISLEPYLMQRNKRKLRVTTTKLRLSDHRLAIEDVGDPQKLIEKIGYAIFAIRNSLKMKNTFYVNVKTILTSEMHS